MPIWILPRSVVEQDLAVQRDALKAAGCEKIYEEKKSVASTERREFRKCSSGSNLVTLLS